MRAILIGLLVLLSACSRERHGYEISANGVAAYVVENPQTCLLCRRVLREVTGADPRTFVQLSADPAFGRDALHAFYEDQIIGGASPASFRQLGDTRYSADESAVFFKAQRVAEADIASFRGLSDDYAVDAHNTYLRGSVVEGARGVLTDIGNGYLRDEANQIFFHGYEAGPLNQIDACDGASFDTGQYLRAPQAWDSQCVYADGVRMPITDRASFRYLGNLWSKDAGGVYFDDQRVDGIDATTFSLVRTRDRTVYGTDASGRCWLGAYVDNLLASCPNDARPYIDPDVSPPSEYAPAH